MKTYLDMGDKYLLLAEFSDRTVNYGRSFFALSERAINRWKKRGQYGVP